MFIEDVDYVNEDQIDSTNITHFYNVYVIVIYAFRC